MKLPYKGLLGRTNGSADLLQELEHEQPTILEKQLGLGDASLLHIAEATHA